MKALFLVLVLLAYPLPLWAAGVSPPGALSNDQKAEAAILDVFNFRYSDNKGVINYAEVYNALGSLAGFGCQMAIREGLIRTGLVPEKDAFIVYRTKNGEKYFFGALLDAQLFGSEKIKTSVWSLVGGAARQAGAKDLPDIREIAAYDTKTLGTKAFGVPRISPAYKVEKLPLAVLKRNWVPMQKILTDNQVDPKFWGWIFALAAQEEILKSKGAFDPGAATRIVMEAAMPMATIDPALVLGAPQVRGALTIVPW